MTDDTQVQAPEVEPSILGVLREARARIGAGAKPLEVTIPGYDGKLVIRFRWVPVRELSRTAKSLQKIKEPSEMQIAAAADSLVATCDEVMVRIDDEVKSLSTNGVPITFSDSERLAYALGFEPKGSARQTCYAVFNNEYALIDVAAQVVTWLEDTSKDVNEEFLGE